MARVGIIGDTHIPYELDGYMDFCLEQFEAWDVDTVVHIGDLVDHHALSFHDSEPELVGANGEYVNAIERLQPWYDAFPEITCINGNHDLIPARQLRKLGMDDKVWMRPLKEVYQMPDGWELADDLWIDGVYYHHGHTALGVNGFRNDSQRRQCRTVTGHAHGNAGVSASACDSRLVWGLATGCGIDVRAMAFAYGKHFLQKPIISCGIVIDGNHPYVEHMDLGRREE